MSISINPVQWPIFLQELIVPYSVQFQDPTLQDFSSCTAVLKVRQALTSASAIITLTSPADIQLTTAGSVTATFTSTHFSTLLSGLTLGDGVYDLIISPLTGTPQMAASGIIGVRRTVSR